MCWFVDKIDCHLHENQRAIEEDIAVDAEIEASGSYQETRLV